MICIGTFDSGIQINKKLPKLMKILLIFTMEICRKKCIIDSERLTIFNKGWMEVAYEFYYRKACGN